MKKVLWGIGIFLALLPTAYVAYAQYMIRGVRIYLVGTEKGQFLASTWQWALIAAALLWLPIVIGVWATIAKKIRSRREIAMPRYEVVSPTQATHGMVEARGKGQPDRLTDLIEPAAPTAQTAMIEPGAPAAETELIEPAAQAAMIEPATPAYGNTDLLQPIASQAETVLLRVDEPQIEAPTVRELPVEEIPVAEPAEEKLVTAEISAEEISAEEPAAQEPAAEIPVAEFTADAGETVLLQPEIAAEPAPAKMKFCGQCGTPVQGRFCANCGAKTE